jgi:FdhD protein
VSDATRPGPSTPRIVHEVVDEEMRRRPDHVITEEPLELRVSWPGSPARRLAVTMRTPGSDFELAAGFLLSEGLVAYGEQPRTITYCLDTTLTRDQQYNVVSVVLDHPPKRAPAARFTAISSACGVCGAQSLDEIFSPDEPPLVVGDRVDSKLVDALPAVLRTAQPMFAKTGAVHAAGVFSFDGSLRVVREDIGRHNAVDKVLGARVLGSAAYDESAVLCVSGRIGFDIVSKAVAGRVSVVLGVGGPSSLAVRLADRAGLTVCGFARGSRYVVYSHPERITIS